MTTVFQYILTSAQSFGYQDYFYQSLMTILGLAGVLFCKMSRHGQNGLSFVPKKILTLVPGEARGDLKATADKRQQPYNHFIPAVFCYFQFLSARVLFSTFCFFQPECCFPGQAMLETISAHRHCGQKPG